MTDSDERVERVERVLAGLREAEVPAGLEERVLRAVKERQAVGVREYGWWPNWLWRLGVYGLGAMAILVVMAGLAWRGFGPRADVAGKKLAARVEVPAPVDRAGRVARPHPATVKLSRRWNTRVVRRGGREQQHVPAVSFPAPPLPLTEQERLLLRVAHGRDPVQMAMLDGVSSFAKLAEGRAEFQRFFEVMPTKVAPETKVESTSTGEEK